MPWFWLTKVLMYSNYFSSFLDCGVLRNCALWLTCALPLL